MIKAIKRKFADFHSLSKSGAGFTLIELMVAISMMVVIAGLFIVNLAAQRSTRSLNIAQNELVSNLRKIQSYTLAGRMINNSQPVQYYVAKFDRTVAGGKGYTLQALYQDSAGVWKLADIERINFPQGVTLDTISGIKINGVNTSSCALLSFQKPFAKIIMNDGCGIAAAPLVQAGDDYKKILDFVFNAGVSPVTDKPFVLKFLYLGSNPRSVLVDGVSGVICPTTNGTTCN